MRTRNYKGEKYEITERDYWQLRRRFNIKNFLETTVADLPTFVNETPCPLCKKYRCRECTFSKFIQHRWAPCFSLARSIVLGSLTFRMTIGFVIIDSTSQKEESFEQIKKIYDFIGGFKPLHK